MALLDIIMPQLINCGQNANQAFNELMDQDWNHWKLQLQSWMEDAKEAAAQATATGGPAPASGPTCGSAPNCGRGSGCGPYASRRRGCCGSASRQTQPDSPFDVLQQIWSQFSSAQQGGQRTAREEATNNHVNNGQRKYVIKLDVQHFEPNEVSVRIVDNQIVVDGEHAERTDRLGRVSRKFQRKYELPADVEPNTIVSTMTPSGVLIIEGLKTMATNESGAEIIIPVIREQTEASNDNQSNYQNEQQMD